MQMLSTQSSYRIINRFDAKNDVLEICGGADHGDDSVTGSRVIIFAYCGTGAFSLEESQAMRIAQAIILSSSSPSSSRLSMASFIC